MPAKGVIYIQDKPKHKGPPKPRTQEQWQRAATKLEDIYPGLAQYVSKQAHSRFWTDYTMHYLTIVYLFQAGYYSHYALKHLNEQVFIDYVKTAKDGADLLACMAKTVELLPKVCKSLINDWLAHLHYGYWFMVDNLDELIHANKQRRSDSKEGK